MRKPQTMKALEELGRIRLSNHFFMRDFLHSEIANFFKIPNIPSNPNWAIETGTQLCQELLEPLHDAFGHVSIRSGYRSVEVTAFGNARGYGASVERNAAYHVWDMCDAKGRKGAGACVVIPWFADEYERGADWRQLAWWIHDHLNYSHLEFYPKLCAFNIQWCNRPDRRIDSFVKPKGSLTKRGMPGHDANHSDWYTHFPKVSLRS